MKNQRQPSGSQFYPRSRMPSLRKKPRDRFKSPRMKKLLSEFEKTRAYMRQHIMRNRNNSANRRDNDVAKKAFMHRSKAFDSSKMVNAKDKQDKVGALQTRQIPQEDSNFRLSNTFMVNGNLVPTAKSARKSNSTLTPSLKDLNQPTTPRLDNDLVSSSKNLKRCKPSISRDGFSSKTLEEHVPLMSKNDSNATLGCSNKSRPLEAKEGSIHNSSNIRRSNSRPNRLKSVVGLVLKENNVDASNQCNNVLGSRLKGRSNLDEEMIVVGKGSIEILKSLKSKQTVTTSKGSNFSMEQELLVSSKDSSNEDKKCQDEVMVDKDKEKGHASVALIERTLSGKVHIMCDDDRHKQEDLLKAKEAPNSSPALKGNQVMQDLQSISRNGSFSIFGKDLSSHQRVEASCMGNNREQNGSQLIDEPIWSGIFKIPNKENVSLAAHLSTKSCENVWSLSKSLPSVVEMTKHSRLEAWPESFEASRPTDDSISLYFFPQKMRPDEDLDQLIKEVMENDMVLRTVIGEAEMLIFPSILLPEPYQTFRRKHYLWGVFMRRRDAVAVVGEHHGAGHHAQEEEMEKQHASHQQDKVQCEESDQETLMNRAMRLKKQWLVGKHRGVDKQDKVQYEESDQETLMNRAMRLKRQRLVGKHRLAVVGEHHGAGHHAQEEEMEKQHASHQQDEVQCEESDQETLMNRAMRLKKQRLVGKHRGVDKQDKVQYEESDQETLMNRAMRLKKQRLVGKHRGVDKQDKVQYEESDQETLMNRAMRLKKQRLVGKHGGVDQQDEVQCEESDQEPLTKPAIRLKKQRLMGTHQCVEKEGVEASTRQVEASSVPGPNMDTELKAPEDANRQDVDKELTPSLAGSNATRLAEHATKANSAATMSANHGQVHSSLGVHPGRIFGFVVRQTPRLEQLIQEIELEGALVVAMQGEMIGSSLGPGDRVWSWPGNSNGVSGTGGLQAHRNSTGHHGEGDPDLELF